jgi:hypothetical protein
LTGSGWLCSSASSADDVLDGLSHVSEQVRDLVGDPEAVPAVEQCVLFEQRVVVEDRERLGIRLSVDQTVIAPEATAPHDACP